MKVLAALLAVAVLAVGCGRANSENAAFVGPLDVIPDLDVEDPLVTCPGTPAVRYSRMIDAPSIDEVDHPAVDALRALLDAPLVEPLPRGLWVVISIDDDRATFATLADDSFWVAAVERRGDKWVRTGQASAGGPCEPAVPLPAGLGRVEVRLDPDSMPGAADTTIDLLVREQGCADGRRDGRRAQGPPGDRDRRRGAGGVCRHPRCRRCHLPGQPVDLGHHRVVRSVGPAWGV